MKTAIERLPGLLPAYDKLLSHGLSCGLGARAPGEMCIEAVWCMLLELPHGDDPECVAKSIRKFKIKLNDAGWSSNVARAKGLYNLGIAQIGTLDIIDDNQFRFKLQTKIIGKLIPDIFRKIFKNNIELLKLADECELNPCTTNASKAAQGASKAAQGAFDTYDNGAYAASTAATYAAGTYATYDAATGAYAIACAYAAHDAATYASDFDEAKDYYLIMAANLALEVLEELGAPAIKYIKKEAA
jgi:hypothetical protein